MIASFRAMLTASRARGLVAQLPLVLLLASIGCKSADELPLDLPGSFTGTLPCADCPGIDWHLDLWPDGRYALARRYRERAASDDELGRWRLGADGETLLLHGGREAPQQFAILDRRSLRMLDRDGAAIVSSLPYALVSAGRLEPTELRLNIGGEFRYFADAAVLEECVSGARYPVLMEGDYAALESAYTAVDKAEPGAPVYARVEGSVLNRRVMDGEGPPQSLRVERFIALQPGMRCERAMSEASLPDTFWRLRALGDEAVATPASEREAHIVFHENDGRVAGTSGCNRFGGTYAVSGDALQLGPLMATRRACPPPLDALERQLFAAYDAVARWHISGQLLELSDAQGETLLVFEAVYLP